MARTELPSTEKTSLTELALLFARVGATAFGGPAAHIAVLREEVVARRGWLDEARFLELLGVVNLLPGPNSTELAIHIGKERRGTAGLAVAGLAFVLPAMAITIALSAFCTRFASSNAVARSLEGTKPVVLAVVAHAAWGLAKSVATTPRARALGFAALALAALGVHELVVLVGAGIAATVLASDRPSRGHAIAPPAPVLEAATSTAITAIAAGASAAATPAGLFVAFAKIGSVLYGSGYVLLAFLRAEFVERLRWATEAQILDAVALGQATPGPVFTAATALGYALAGLGGALAATAGIFLPAFAFVAVAGPLARVVRGSARGAAFLEGVNLASLALMLEVACELGVHAVGSPRALVVALASFVGLVRTRLDPTWLLVGGAALGAAWP